MHTAESNFLPCRTKIVCTLGPASDKPEIIRRMIQSGMAVARVNFSHGTEDENASLIRLCRQVADQIGAVVGVLADLQGPKLRIGTFAEGRVLLERGQAFTLSAHACVGDEARVHVPHPEVLEAIEVGSTILLGDGDIELVAVAKQNLDVMCRVEVGGTLSSHKGIVLPGCHLPVSPITKKDCNDLRVALRENVDWIALSFVEEASDVERLRALIAKEGKDTPVVAKIERQRAIKEFDAILATADAIMVARGDLGLEVPAEEVPIYQKELINKCRLAGKPVITATQMLESMLNNPRPTRAEASDVANAILDGTDAVMLSGETAVGRYPVESVRMMRRIARVAEAHLPHRQWRYQALQGSATTVTEAISQATYEIAGVLGAQAILAATMSGWTARMVAKHRPSAPVIGVTPSRDVVGRLTLAWGVVPLLVPSYDTTDDMTCGALKIALQKGLVQPDDLVVVTAGVPVGGHGRTNMIRVHHAAELLEAAP